MKQTTANSWWHRATTEQRLAQLDGGIACGATARFIARASGLDGPDAVFAFAQVHGRNLARGGNSTAFGTKGLMRSNAVRRNRAAYFRGEPIDPWGHDAGRQEFALDEVSL